jgi:hypothetical protein
MRAGQDMTGQHSRSLVNLGVRNLSHFDYLVSPNSQRHSLAVKGRPAEADLSLAGVVRRPALRLTHRPVRTSDSMC